MINWLKDQKNIRQKQVLFAFVVLILSMFYLVRMVNEAHDADARTGQRVIETNDQTQYQRWAVNLLLYGSYSQNIRDPQEYDIMTRDPAVIEDIQANWDAYGHLVDLSEPMRPSYFRPPGVALHLAAVYKVFDNTTLVMRLHNVAVFMIVPFIIMGIGWLVGGWRGILVAGVSSVLWLESYALGTDFAIEKLMSEPFAMFWILFFFLFLVLYERQRHLGWLILGALAIGFASLVRVNAILVIGFAGLFMLMSRYSFRDIVIFGLLAFTPAIVWSAYISSYYGFTVFMGDPTGVAYWAHNNPDVLNGVGPDRLFAGDENKGGYIDDEGNYVITEQYVPSERGQGQQEAFKFWRENWQDLPRLAYVKGRIGFWGTLSSFAPSWLLSFGIGFGLMMPAFRTKMYLVGNERLRRRLFYIHVGLIALMPVWWWIDFLVVALIYLFVFVTAWILPYGRSVRLPNFVTHVPTWLLIPILAHLTTTMIFRGVRFHIPYDPMIIFFGCLSVLLVGMTVYRRYLRNT